MLQELGRTEGEKKNYYEGGKHGGVGSRKWEILNTD